MIFPFKNTTPGEKRVSTKQQVRIWNYLIKTLFCEVFNTELLMFTYLISC